MSEEEKPGPGPEAEPGPWCLVPLAVDLRSTARGCALGSAAALLVTGVGKPGGRDWSYGHVGMQLVVVGCLLVLFTVQLARPKARASRSARYGSAVPLRDPAGLRPDAAGTRRLLRLDAAVMGMGSALTVFVTAALYDMPVLGAGATGVLVPLMLLVERPTRAWQREHAVVLWRPAIGFRTYGTSALYSTPAEPGPEPSGTAAVAADGA